MIVRALLVLGIVLSLAHASLAVGGNSTASAKHPAGIVRPPVTHSGGVAAAKSSSSGAGAGASTGCMSASKNDLVFACQGGAVVANATLKAGKSCECSKTGGGGGGGTCSSPVTCTSKGPGVSLANGHPTLAFMTHDLLKNCREKVQNVTWWLGTWNCEPPAKTKKNSTSTSGTTAGTTSGGSGSGGTPVPVIKRSKDGVGSTGKLCKVASRTERIVFTCPKGLLVHNATARAGQKCDCALNACSVKGGVKPTDLSSKVSSANNRQTESFDPSQLIIGTLSGTPADTYIYAWRCSSSGGSGSPDPHSPPKIKKDSAGEFDVARDEQNAPAA